MGYYKDLEIERMENPFFDVPEMLVGENLFENRLLKDLFQSYGKCGISNFSGKKDKVLPLKDVLIFMYDLLCGYFGDANNEGVGWDSHLDVDPAPGFHAECGGYVVPDDRSYYNDIGRLLYEKGFIVNDDKLWEIIVENFPDINWIEKDPYGLNEAEERVIDWRELKQLCLKCDKKSLSYKNLKVADRTRLFSLLETIQSISTLIIKEMDLELYRTVNYKTAFDPEPVFSDLTSPPDVCTQNLRMSPKGISFFYGASSLQLSRDEALSTGTARFAYTGLFKTKAPLILLDLRNIREEVSIFDMDRSVYYSILFLQHFAREISLPVQDERDYIPTQFITEYFQHSLNKYNPDNSKRPIDGILYDSSKNPSEWNAALFYDNHSSANILTLDKWFMEVH